MHVIVVLALVCIILFSVMMIQYALNCQGNAVPYNELVGRSTWLSLHALADHFPINPSSEEKIAATNLIGAYALLYPCEKCRTRLKEIRDVE